jgi:tetratricopeptide (TPR) repeat protein
MKATIYAKEPSQEQLSLLLQQYQNGRYPETEKLALTITQEFPKHQFAWTMLGIVLKQTGRISESLVPSQEAVALCPQDAEAHYNLGLTFAELKRLHEAEGSYTQAIALKFDFAEAHSNLGVTLQELGRLDEAEASYTQAIALKPDFAEAHYNLGTTFQALGRLKEAEENYTQAIALKPDYAEALNNCGVTLQELGRLDEALASYKQAIALKPDFAEAMLNISFTQSYMNNLEAEIVSLKNVLRIDSDDYGLKAGVNLAICNFLEGDFTESKKLLLAATKIQEKTSSISKNERVYSIYLSNILKWHENKYIANKKGKNDTTLYVLGESHSLTSHHLRIQYSEIDFFCSARLIKGCKQWHLGNAFRNQYKHQFESIFFALPKHSYVLVAIGEIDCRLESGIIAHKRKFPEKQIREIISNTIENYLNYIVNNNSDCQHNVTIQGVPCPNLDFRNHSEKDIRQLVEVIKIFNYELKMQSKETGFGFLDIHQLTNKGDGMSNGFWHIDDYHLSPGGMQEAWRRCGSEKSYEQFKKKVS